MENLFSRQLDKFDWVEILRFFPERVNECPCLDIFDGVAWWWLLSKQPQLDVLCDWQKLKGLDWAFLLGFMPQYADKCQWQKFNGEDWRNLLIRLLKKQLLKLITAMPEKPEIYLVQKDLIWNQQTFELHRNWQDYPSDF